MLNMTLVAPEQMGEIARPGVLYVTLCISNETSEVLELPALIGPEFGSLRVEVTPEGDDPYWMQPTDEHCSEARTAILPGQQIFRSFALAGNPVCPLFRKDCAHLVRLQLVDHQNPRASCVATTAFPVNVATAAETAISAKALTTVLDRRTSRSRATALLKNISDSGAPMALHGQVHLARRARTSRDRDTLQGIAEDVEAPLVIRHAAAARTARRRIDQGADWRKVAEDYRAIFAAPVHDEFYETVERFGVGRSRMLALAGER